MPKYEIVTDEAGDTVSISIDKIELNQMVAGTHPPGPIPGPRLGKIYYYVSNPSPVYCVKRFGRWW